MALKIPIPEPLRHLPLDPRGFPIPYNVLVDKKGVAHFKVNDEQKARQCLALGLCHVCGKPYGEDRWLIGGHLSAFHERGAFNDAPVHHLCGEFALQVCPYLAYTQYRAADSEDKTKEIAKKLEHTDVKALYNPTQTMERLPFFVFAQVSGFLPIPQAYGTFVFRPKKPYLEIQYWRDGKQITYEEAATYLSKADRKLLPKPTGK
jgi:hypothetical protein